MMMQNPEDNLFRDLLSDYAAPIEDDGFTKSVMRSIEHENPSRSSNLRRGLIFGACVIGGLMAAIQLPGLFRLMGQTFSPDLVSLSSLGQSSWMLGAITVVGLLLICALDQKTSELF